MDSEIEARIVQKWAITRSEINRYESLFNDVIKPLIKENYLSHLVTTIENMVNDKRMARIIDELENNTNWDFSALRALFASRTVRLYSIMLVRMNLKRRATTRYHPSGAIIYYNSAYGDKEVRILIAHELGHIVSRELFLNAQDSEQTANLFAYIAMEDKNEFYKNESKKYISHSDIQIFNDIDNICPT